MCVTRYLQGTLDKSTTNVLNFCDQRLALCKVIPT